MKRTISAEACREFFNHPLPKTKMLSPLLELGSGEGIKSIPNFSTFNLFYFHN